MLFCLFVCFRRFPASSHFFVSQVFEVGDVDRALGEWREFISTEKAFCISSFKIPEYFSITLLFLVLFWFFFMPFCGGRLVSPLSNYQLLGGSLFRVKKALQKNDFSWHF